MKTRLISALILLPIGIAVILIGGGLFDLAMAFIFTLAVYEFVQLMKAGKFAPNLIFAVAFVWVLLLDAVLPRLAISRPALALLLIAALTWQMRHREGSPTANWALTVAGGVYLGVAGAHFILIRQLNNGEWWLLLALAGTWLADSGAYLIGRKFGVHKMTPALSPKKSWEGLAGGVVFGVICDALLAVVLSLALNISIPWWAGAVLGLIGALIGVLGDLSISMIKREVGAKDTGHIIPGHGGVLDRLDSLLFTMIVSYYFIVWVVTP
ncbi:MAG TPA: phosphatidate cytidylyltransferase [Anaerolineae bacterium]|nr:phosphatidate cytidylyltransferase [Anaerolineae bacterium]